MANPQQKWERKFILGTATYATMNCWKNPWEKADALGTAFRASIKCAKTGKSLRESHNIVLENFSFQSKMWKSLYLSMKKSKRNFWAKPGLEILCRNWNDDLWSQKPCQETVENPCFALKLNSCLVVGRKRTEEASRLYFVQFKSKRSPTVKRPCLLTLSTYFTAVAPWGFSRSPGHRSRERWLDRWCPCHPADFEGAIFALDKRGHKVLAPSSANTTVS